jgi:hypothetical protein
MGSVRRGGSMIYVAAWIISSPFIGLYLAHWIKVNREA